MCIWQTKYHFIKSWLDQPLFIVVLFGWHFSFVFVKTQRFFWTILLCCCFWTFSMIPLATFILRTQKTSWHSDTTAFLDTDIYFSGILSEQFELTGNKKPFSRVIWWTRLHNQHPCYKPLFTLCWTVLGRCWSWYISICQPLLLDKRQRLW